jgi:hypothetical protein
MMSNTVALSPSVNKNNRCTHSNIIVPRWIKNFINYCFKLALDTKFVIRLVWSVAWRCLLN